MSRKPKIRGSATAAQARPIKPGSPLYHALELIAREVAKRLETKPACDDKPSRQR